MRDDEDTLADSESENSLPSSYATDALSLRGANASISAADRAEVRAIEEMAYGFKPASEEEMMLAGQLALTNRAGIAAMMRGYLAADRRGDNESTDMAVKLMTLSLKQLEALNKQRVLRRLRAPDLRGTPSRKSGKKSRKR